MGWQIGDKRYALHVRWPYSWQQDIVLYSDADFKPMENMTQAVKEAERWKVNGNGKSATTVTIFEEVMRLV